MKHEDWDAFLNKFMMKSFSFLCYNDKNCIVWKVRNVIEQHAEQESEELVQADAAISATTVETPDESVDTPEAMITPAKKKNRGPRKPNSAINFVP